MQTISGYKPQASAARACSAIDQRSRTQEQQQQDEASVQICNVVLAAKLSTLPVTFLRLR